MFSLPSNDSLRGWIPSERRRRGFFYNNMALTPDQEQRHTMGTWLAERAQRFGSDLGTDKQPNQQSVDSCIPIQISSNFRKLVKRADQNRRDELLRAFAGLDAAVLASTSRKKIAGLEKLLVALIGDQGNGFLASAVMADEEITSKSVMKVANQKARAAYCNHIEQTGQAVDNRILELIRIFQEVHAVDEHIYQEIKEFMPKGMAFLGADVNFWTVNPDGSWQQQHKLERLNRELTDSEFLQFAEKLKAYYCHPELKEVRVLWDIGVVALNGGLHEFHDQIEVVAEPIDEYLFWQYMLEAKDTKQLYTYNPHFALIECLMAQGKIKTLATLSNEERKLGLKMENKRFTPCDADLQVVQTAVSGNRPPRIPD